MRKDGQVFGFGGCWFYMGREERNSIRGRGKEV